MNTPRPTSRSDRATAGQAQGTHPRPIDNWNARTGQPPGRHGDTHVGPAPKDTAAVIDLPGGPGAAA